MLNRTGQPGVSIVIPTWNGRALLEKFLPSVIDAATAFEAACHEASEIVIADDASTDDTRAWLSARFRQVRCESSQRRQGFAPAANRGVRAAQYGLVYLLNNDVALDRATLTPLAAHFADPAVFSVTGQVYDYRTGVLRGAGQIGEFRRGFLSVHRRYFVPPESGNLPAPFLTLFTSGGSALFDRAKFMALGGFNEDFAPFGWEDVELSLRAWRHGFEVRYEPRSAVWHQVSSTINPGFPRRSVRTIYERNRLLTHWLHLDKPSEVISHAFFLLLKLLADPFVGRWEIWSACAQALRLRHELSARRQKQPATGQRQLQEVLRAVFEQLRRPGVQPLNSRSAPLRPYLPSLADSREDLA